MKRIYLIIIALSINASINAQNINIQNELSVLVGAGGPLCCGVEHNDQNICHLYSFEYWSPTISLVYYRHLTQKLACGTKLSYMHWNDKCQEQVTPWNGISNNSCHNCYSIMPSIKYDWLQKKYFRIHSSIGVGVGMNYQNQTYYGKHKTIYYDPVWDFTAVGIEVGGPHLSGIIDLNIGMATLFSAGINYHW